MSRQVSTKQHGFTIVELLIATLVFSVVLVVVTTGILQFSRQYYKGVIATNTQNTARAIADEITRAIQFNNGRVSELTNGGDGVCIGSSRRYSFSKNYQVAGTYDTTDHQGYHGLVVDTGVSNCSPSTNAHDVKRLATLSGITGAREMLSERMRLVTLKVEDAAIPGAYRVDVKVAYGDDDLLCNFGLANSCTGNMNRALDIRRDDIRCKPITGSQFCAVSELSTTVQMRVK